MKRRFATLVLLGISFGSLLLVYQNCSQIKLAQKTAPSLAVAPEGARVFKPRLCLADGAPVGVPKRYLFIVDMSASNIVAPGVLNNPETDPTGIRFDAIRDFVATCAAPGSAFALLGFSQSGLKSDGAVATSANSCRSYFPFVSNAQINQQIQSMKALNNSKNGKPPDLRAPMLDTRYEKAFECAAQAIDQDLTTVGNPVNAIYSVLFITDGRPTNVAGNNLEANDTSRQMILNSVGTRGGSVQTLLGASTPAASLRITSVYYGSSADLTAAKYFLDPIANASVPDNPTLLIDDLSDADQLKETLCQAEKNPVRTGWNIADWGVVNMNALMRGGVLMADSDADGIIDDEESRYTTPFLVGDRRTSGAELLDGICTLYGAAGSCRAPVACDKTRIDALGLSECDNSVIGGRQFPFDADGDSVPDLVELIKGTSGLPSGRDFDFDGISNETELKRGSNPLEPDSNANPSQLVLVTPIEVTNQCIGIETTYLPVLPMPAFNDSAPPAEGLNFSHAANENLYFIYLLGRSSTGQRELRGMLVPVKAGDTPDLSRFPPKKLGEW